MAHRIPFIVVASLTVGCAGASTTSESPTALTTAAAEPELPPKPATPDEPALQFLPGVAVFGVDVDCGDAAVFFSTDSAELSPDDERVLEQVAACLKGTADEEKLEITGRADPRGTETYNEELSRDRADAVAAYLKEQGVSGDQFEIRARGEKGMREDVPVLWPAQRHATVETHDED